ncbi:MAG: CCA tRNA nucleotidyltransferase, partial [Vulcanococcus sp.]
MLPGDAVALCRQLQRHHGGSAVVLDAGRSIARLVLKGWSVDLARQEGGSLSADLQRRDYTINAMALPLAEPWT